MQHRRPSWPAGERAPDEGSAPVEVRDICPPWTYPSPIPAPPAERKPCDPRGPTVSEALLCEAAREIAKEIANYAFNPYLFPTPFSQDFDQPGENTVPALPPPHTRFRVARFKVPAGYVGVWEGIGVEIPPALQSFTVVHPTLNDGTLKNFSYSTFIGSGPVTPIVRPGVPYVLGTLLDPRRVHHPLQEEMVVGVEIELLPGAPAGAFPATFRGLVRGRYWPPTLATRYWTYSKSS